MKDKIKALIERQLGVLPEEITTGVEAQKYLNSNNIPWDWGNGEHWILHTQTAVLHLETEQSRRELLAALMEEICWDEAYERNIEVIEKPLSMP